MSLVATSDLALRVANCNWEVGSFTPYPKQPANFDAQDIGERLQFIIENAAMILFDLRNGSSIELYTDSRELP